MHADTGVRAWVCQCVLYNLHLIFIFITLAPRTHLRILSENIITLLYKYILLLILISSLIQKSDAPKGKYEKCRSLGIYWKALINGSFKLIVDSMKSLSALPVRVRELFIQFIGAAEGGQRALSKLITTPRGLFVTRSSPSRASLVFCDICMYAKAPTVA